MTDKKPTKSAESAKDDAQTKKTNPKAKASGAKAPKETKAKTTEAKTTKTATVEAKTTESAPAKDKSVARAEARLKKAQEKAAKREVAKATDAQCDNHSCGCHHNDNTFVMILAILAIIVSGVSLVFTTYNMRGSYFTLFDGNNTSFESGSIAEIANKVSPSVVSVLTETRTQSYYGTETATAAGTGFIISSDGYVVTNKHVVDSANSVSVVLDDGTTYDKVTIVGTDPLNDVAILKITADTEFQAIAIGDSKTLNIGQDVLAIGNALGQYQNTVTSGIISGLNRTIVASNTTGSVTERLTDMIQTDASINQGNSGGPLVNAAGQVIGINTAVSSGSNGIGFAIPISSVRGLLRNVVENGKVARAYLGVYYLNITPEVAKEYNLPVTAGAYIKNSSGSAVISDSAAAKAGLKEGDIVTAVNGVKIGSAGSLSALVAEYMPDETIELTIIRDGNEQTVKVTLGTYQTSSTSQKS